MRSRFQASWKELELWNEPLNEKANNRDFRPGPEVIKLFFKLSSAKHEISTAHKYLIVKMGGKFRFKTQKLLLYPAYKC